MDFKNKIKASVLIFTYNRKQFIKNALDSVIASQQMIDNVEVIISSCISRDELELEPVPKNVRFVIFPAQTLYGDQLIETVKISTGEILFFLEDDDVFNYHKIKIVLDLFQSNSEVIAVKNGYTKIKSEEYIDESTFEKEHEVLHHINKSRDYNTDLLTPRDIYDMILDSIVFNPSTISVKKSVILENEDVIRNNDPIDILLSAAILNSHGLIKYLDKNLTAYRLHSSNDSYFGQERNVNQLKDRMLKTSNKYVDGLNGAYDVTTLRPTARLLIQFINSQTKFMNLILLHHGSRDILIKAVINNFAREYFLGKQIIMKHRIIDSSFIMDFLIPFIKMTALKTLAKRLPMALIYLFNRNLAYKIYINYTLWAMSNSR